MLTSKTGSEKRTVVQLFQGLLPIDISRVPSEIIAGLTLAALAVPEVMGYTKISGTPVITGLYTMLIPMALLAVTGVTFASWALGLQEFGITVFGAGPSGLPDIGLPHVAWSRDLILTLLPTAFTMFVVILAQSAATSRA